MCHGTILQRYVGLPNRSSNNWNAAQRGRMAWIAQERVFRLLSLFAECLREQAMLVQQLIKIAAIFAR